ncbi:MAG: sulfite exporter TauE/SafE family protein [Pseudomonadota bacterium]
MTTEILFILAGFGVGFVVGMTGIGGGSLMTPLLVLGFGVKPAIAVGTDLLYAAITKSGGIFVHHAKGNINWKIMGLLSLGSIPASLISLLFLKRLEEAGVNYDDIIMSTLSFALILTALFLFARNKIQHFVVKSGSNVLDNDHSRVKQAVTVFAGILIGALVTISSVGAGVIGAAILFIMYPRMKTIQIAATDLAHAVPITAIAGLGHAHIGTVDYVLLGTLLIGSLPGIYFGSHVGSFLPEKIMRPLLATMLFAIGVKLVI